MITKTKRNTIQRQGVESEGKFQIKATGKAFRILSDGLYSDKITAILRELSCNAYDAHVDAGNLDKPFVIHLPNRLEPHFSIRDFGVGLSHDDVINVYTTYFESTKTESNDYIGCLGLGSKSPFSYVDNFSIVSFYNGEKRVYNAFLNEEETPTIALMATTTTKEPNGVEVSFPVQANDTRMFEEKAEAVFTYFKLKPEFTGAKVEIDEVEYILEGSNWGVRKGQYRGSAKAVMGNVAYDLDDFSGELDDAAMRSLIHGVPIDIFFNIGDLEVAASRESLSYNKRTIANVKSVCEKIIGEIRKEAGKKIKDCKNLWEARVLAHEIMQGEYAHLKEILANQKIFVWNGTEVGGSYHKIETKGVEVLCFQPKTSWRRRRNTNGPSVSRETTNNVQTKNSSRLFYADINRGSHLRCRQVILESKEIEGSKRGYYGQPEREVMNVYLVHGDTTSVEALRKELGLAEIPPISSIEKKKDSTVYKTTEYNPKNATRLLVYETDNAKHEYGTPSTYWRNEKIRVTDGGIYVEIERYKVNGDHPEEYFNRIAEELKLIGESLDKVEIIGAKASVVDKLTAKDGWKTLDQYMREKYEAYVKANNIESKIGIANALHNLDRYGDRVRNLVLKMNLDKTKPAGKYVERVSQLRKKVGKYETLVAIYRVHNRLTHTTGKEKKVIDLQKEWEAVEKQYPLLAEVDSWNIEKRKAAIQEYIQALDLIKF